MIVSELLIAKKPIFLKYIGILRDFDNYADYFADKKHKDILRILLESNLI